MRAHGRAEATRQLAAFVAEVDNHATVVRRDLPGLTFDEAVERFLVEHLAEEKGREPKTVADYRRRYDLELLAPAG